MKLLDLLLLITCSSPTSSFLISDYFCSSSSFDGYLYGSDKLSEYVVHDIFITIDSTRFGWVLLGQERGCEVKIDQSPGYSGALSLHGASTRFLPLPKKQYNVALKTNDGVKHNIVLRNTYRDPAFCREKVTHDVIRNCNGHAVQTAHANVYINGEYNGLYQVFEDIDFKFLDDSFADGNIDMWYYVRRIFEIQIETVEEEEGEEEGDEYSSYTTSQHEILNLNYETASSQKIILYNPVYQVANMSHAVHDLFHFESLAAFFISIKLMNVMDTFYHNYGLARNVKDLLLYPILWDADKSLGVFAEDSNIGYLGLSLPFKVMDRYIYPSAYESIEGTQFTEDSLYRNLSLGFMSPGGAISNQSLQEVVNIFSESLAKSAKRDQEKWSRWYCANRMNFNEATEEMKKVLETSHWNFLQVLQDTPEQMKQDQWADSFECDDQYYGKPDRGMIAFLSVIAVLNLFSFLIPKYCGNVLLSLGKGRETEEEGEEKGSFYLLLKTLFTQQYYDDCKQQFFTYEYSLNVFVSFFLLGSYLVYAYLDVLDSSEILGEPYMQQIQYIWIYFIVIMNIGFHIPRNWLRISLWASVVVVSNIYAIVDLIAFAGADSDKSASNSRGLTLSLDNTESPRVFILYIWFRVICQVIFMLYSLQIPSLSKETTDDWDTEYLKCPEYQRSMEEEEDNKSPYHRDQDQDISDLEEAVSSKRNLDGNPSSASRGSAEYEMVVREPSSGNSSAIDDHNHDLSKSSPHHHSTVTIESDDANGNNEERSSTNQILLSQTEYSSPKNAEPTTSATQAEYKHQMKRFMQINMLVFIAVCVGYVIYLGVVGTLKETAGEVAFSTIISVVILINIRAVYSCAKWFWLYAYGFDSSTLSLLFSSRDDQAWQLDHIRTMKLHYRKYAHYLPFNKLNTERKIRTVDGWIKKIAHTYDGLMVFILSTSSFAEGGETAETFSYAYTVSLIYMSFYMITFNSNGPFAWILYGAKARIMDGFLGRENEIFGYMFDKYMLPISVPLLIWLRKSAGDDVLVLMSWYIFMPIIIGDSVAEIVGGTWGKQKIRVWGMGEINRKSWEGTNAMFISSLSILLVLNIVRGLSWKWYFFAILNCFVATMIELWAYRSTDNVCMLIASALLGVAFTRIL
jgi:hypothetical protein